MKTLIERAEQSGRDALGGLDRARDLDDQGQATMALIVRMSVQAHLEAAIEIEAESERMSMADMIVDHLERAHMTQADIVGLLADHPLRRTDIEAILLRRATPQGGSASSLLRL